MRRISVIILNLFACIAYSQNLPQTQNLTKMEQEIKATVADVFSGVDELDWKRIHNVLADSILVDYTSLNGGEPKLQTPKELTDTWASFLPGFTKTHHEVSDFTIKTNSNLATAYYTGKADHYIDNEVWKVQGTFETALEKLNNKWKVTKHKFIVASQSGNTELPKKAMAIVKSKKSNALKEKITFSSDGLVLVGDLYKPANFDKSIKYPAVLVGGSWTTVKEQMSGLYARELAEKGFITLAIDPRYFGESEGEPRFLEKPAAKIADYRNAINYLETVDNVDPDNIFLAAVCASAGYMATLAAEDSRIKGIATVAAWLHDAESVKPLYGGEKGVKMRIEQAKIAKQKFANTGEVLYIPTVSKTDKTAAMAGDFNYYLDPERGAVPGWSADKFAVMGWEDWLKFNPMPIAKNLNKPTLMIHSDDAALPDNTKTFFSNIPYLDKVLHWTEGTQFDFYDQPKQISESVAAIDRFFKAH